MGTLDGNLRPVCSVRLGFLPFSWYEGRLKVTHLAQNRQGISPQRRRESRETRAVLTSSQIICVVGVPEGRQ